MMLDDAYANAAYIDGADGFPPRWEKEAEAFRASLGARAQLNVRYGPSDRQKFFGLGNRTRDLCTAEVGDLCDDIAPRGIGHFKGAVFTVDPLAADIGAGFKQAGVFQQ